jgi:Meiotically up-regulated gene 113
MTTSYLYIVELNHHAASRGWKSAQHLGVTVEFDSSSGARSAGGIESVEVGEVLDLDRAGPSGSQKNPQSRRTPSIYFFQINGSDGPIKIGHSRDVDKRLSNIRMGSPYRLEMLASLYIDNAPAIERQLHIRFGASHIRGEWFACSQELLDLAHRVSQYAAERLCAYLSDDPLPPIPPELVETEVDDWIPIDIGASAMKAVRATRKVARACDPPRGPRRIYEPPGPQNENEPPSLKRGQFIWRGKVRNS